MTGRTTPPLPARALLLAGAATSAGALWTAANVPWSMMFWSDRAFGALVATLAASVLLSAFAAAPRRRRAACPTGAGLARGIAAFALVAAVPWFYWLQPFKALWLLMYAGCATGAFAVLYVIAPWTGRCGAVGEPARAVASPEGVDAASVEDPVAPVLAPLEQVTDDIQVLTVAMGAQERGQRPRHCGPGAIQVEIRNEQGAGHGYGPARELACA